MAEDVIAIERAAKAIYFAGDGAHWDESFHDQIWAGSQGLRDEDYEVDGGDEYDDVLVRGRNWYRAQARAALLAALDPEDEALVEGITFAADQARRNGWLSAGPAVIEFLRNHIGQGETKL